MKKENSEIDVFHCTSPKKVPFFNDLLLISEDFLLIYSRYYISNNNIYHKREDIIKYYKICNIILYITMREIHPELNHYTISLMPKEPPLLSIPLPPFPSRKSNNNSICSISISTWVRIVNQIVSPLSVNRQNLTHTPLRETRNSHKQGFAPCIIVYQVIRITFRSTRPFYWDELHARALRYRYISS